MCAIATTMHGFASIWCLLVNCGMRFTHREAEQLRIARRRALEGYHWLSLHASHSGRFLWCLKPKFHKLDECLRRAARTRLNPGFYWAFADEDWIGQLSRLAASTHRCTMQRRVAERWLVHFFGDLEHD